MNLPKLSPLPLLSNVLPASPLGSPTDSVPPETSVVPVKLSQTARVHVPAPNPAGPRGRRAGRRVGRLPLLSKTTFLPAVVKTMGA